MNKIVSFLKLASLVAGLLVVSSCGGGGSSTATPTPTPTVTPATSTAAMAALVTDKSSPLVAVAFSGTGTESFGVLSEKDSNGNATNTLGYLLKNNSENSSTYVSLNADGSIKSILYSDNSTAAFSNVTTTTVDITLTDKSGKQFSPVTVPFSLENSSTASLKTASMKGSSPLTLSKALQVPAYIFATGECGVEAAVAIVKTQAAVAAGCAAGFVLGPDGCIAGGIAGAVFSIFPAAASCTSWLMTTLKNVGVDNNFVREISNITDATGCVGAIAGDKSALVGCGFSALDFVTTTLENSFTNPPAILAPPGSCTQPLVLTNGACIAPATTPNPTTPALIVTTSSLPGATVGTPYAQSLVVSGGLMPYGWSISNGQPAGLNINGTTGSISGTPTVSGTFNFSVVVADSSTPKNISSQRLSISVAESASASPGNFTVKGTPYCETSHGSPTGAVLLEWGQSSTATSYDIVRDGTTVATGITELGARNTSTDLTGQTHSYVIRAHNSSATTTDSNFGIALTVTVPSNVCASSVPATPSGLIPGSTSSPGPTLLSSAVAFSWSAPTGATSYGGITDVATGSDVFTINTSGTSYSASLSPSKQYRWYVYACNSSGCSSPSLFYYFQTPAVAQPCTVSFNSNNDSVVSSGALRQIILTTSGQSCTWSATSDQSWVHNITPSSGTSGATLTYTVDANTSAQARSATITAGQASLTISQVGTPASCTFSLGFTTRSIAASGGTLAVGLTASNETCPRTAQSNSAFITDVNPASGNGTANIGFTVAANTSTSSRSGTLTIAGQTVTVSQDGAALPCTVSFNSTNDSVASSGAQRQVILSTSGSSCSWSATSNQSWVHNITPSSGTSGATLTYTVDANTSPQARSATITAGQASLAISQPGTAITPPPTALIDANPTSVPASGQATLTWSSTNATSCTASNGWSGGKATSGSQTVTVSATPGTQNFGLSCTNGSGQTVYTGVNVTVTAGPRVTLGATPTSINNGQSATLTWSSSNTSSCTASSGWSGSQSTSGSVTVYPNSNTTYVLTCNGTDGTTVIANATVTVATPPGPTASIDVNPTSVRAGGQATLTWSSTNATSCTANHGWTGTKATAGSQTVTVNLTPGTQNFGLSCTNGLGLTAYTGVNVTVTN